MSGTIIINNKKKNVKPPQSVWTKNPIAEKNQINHILCLHVLCTHHKSESTSSVEGIFCVADNELI